MSRSGSTTRRHLNNEVSEGRDRWIATKEDELMRRDVELASQTPPEQTTSIPDGIVDAEQELVGGGEEATGEGATGDGAAGAGH